jgi:hypothetical protein
MESRCQRQPEFAAMSNHQARERGMQESIYTSIFLHPEWAAEKYYGWTCIRQESSLRVIRKRVGPVEKTLFMANGIGDHDLRQRLLKMEAQSGLVSTYCTIFVVRKRVPAWKSGVNFSPFLLRAAN